MTIDTKKLRELAERRHDFTPQTVIALLDEIEKLRSRQQELLATIVRVTNETPFPEEVAGALGQRGALLAEIGSLRSQLAAANAEIERLRNRVLQPLTPREIEEALHEGRAEAMAATGDNAWTSLLRQRDEARDQLAAMTKARDEACGLCDVAITMHGETVGMRERIAELRKVGAK